MFVAPSRGVDVKLLSENGVGVEASSVGKADVEETAAGVEDAYRIPTPFLIE